LQHSKADAVGLPELLTWNEGLWPINICSGYVADLGSLCVNAILMLACVPIASEAVLKYPAAASDVVVEVVACLLSSYLCK
jgi:hypothetical protein